MRRLVKMAGAVAERPGGTVTSAMRNPAECEGAFRFLESRRVDTNAIKVAICKATAVRSREQTTVFVAIDQSDLTYLDKKSIRGLGPAHNKDKPWLSQTQVMTGLALDEAGVPLGVLGQRWWLRPEERTPRRPIAYDYRQPERRESWAWVQTCEDVLEEIAEFARSTKPWFIMDRGADYGLLLQQLINRGAMFTVRAAYNRIIYRGGRKQKLFPTLARQPVLANVRIDVPKNRYRLPRRATFEIRALSSVSVRMQKRPESAATLSAVRIREISRVPEGEKPIEWILLTTLPLTSAADAKKVLKSYTLRWSVEEFHRTWKSGACNVERSQLRSYDAIKRWATILAAVAARVERLKRLSREEPDRDALSEISREEIDAAILLTQTNKHKVGAHMTIAEAVKLIAQAGGYLGRNRDGPPGSITIARGLDRLTPAALVLRGERNG